MVYRATRLLAGVTLMTGLVLAGGAQAQSNPFVPQSSASRAEIERVVDAKMKEVEARMMAAAVKAGAAKAGGAPTGAPGAPGAPVTPGAPGSPITPGAPGAGPLAPGAMGPSYPPVGAIGGAGLTTPGGMTSVVGQGGVVDQARGSGTRFVGCINGVHKFMKQTGERVTFSPAQITRAVKGGELPACR